MAIQSLLAEINSFFATRHMKMSSIHCNKTMPLRALDLRSIEQLPNSQTHPVMLEKYEG
jgi:hypothetical protein